LESKLQYKAIIYWNIRSGYIANLDGYQAKSSFSCFSLGMNYGNICLLSGEGLDYFLTNRSTGPSNDGDLAS
jgi:hypothetical protein